MWFDSDLPAVWMQQLWRPLHHTFPARHFLSPARLDGAGKRGRLMTAFPTRLSSTVLQVPRIFQVQKSILKVTYTETKTRERYFRETNAVVCLSISFSFTNAFFFAQTCGCPGRKCVELLTRLTVSVLHLKRTVFPKAESLRCCSLCSESSHLVPSQSDFCFRRLCCACPNKINLTGAVLLCRLGSYITKHVIAHKRQQIVGVNNSRLLTCSGMWPLW